jgi:hypothetical protein
MFRRVYPAPKPRRSSTRKTEEAAALRSTHDQLFKLVFSRQPEAAGFLQAHLPPALASAIDWPSLTLRNTSYQDPEGANFAADLVFSAPLRLPGGRKTDVEVAILFEHQSTPAAHMPLRLLGYMVRGYEKQLNEQGRRRPAPIIPVVLYHSQRRWTAPRGFARWLGVPDAARELLKDYIPCRVQNLWRESS